MKQFGRRVRAFRERLSLSQEGLAERVGLDRTYVSGVERGVRNPTLASMQRLAVGLSTTLEELVAGIEEDQ